jgi:hypothetical protein
VRCVVLIAVCQPSQFNLLSEQPLYSIYWCILCCRVWSVSWVIWTAVCQPSQPNLLSELPNIDVFFLMQGLKCELCSLNCGLPTLAVQLALRIASINWRFPYRYCRVWSVSCVAWTAVCQPSQSNLLSEQPLYSIYWCILCCRVWSVSYVGWISTSAACSRSPMTAHTRRDVPHA